MEKLVPTSAMPRSALGPELQPLAAIMFHKQGMWDCNCFGTIAADGDLGLDFNIHGGHFELLAANEIQKGKANHARSHTETIQEAHQCKANILACNAM